MPLTKWLAAIHLVGTDKDGVSALRLSNMIGVQWRTARLILKKLGAAMAERDSRNLLDGLIELDDAYVVMPGKGLSGARTGAVCRREQRRDSRFHVGARGCVDSGRWGNSVRI